MGLALINYAHEGACHTETSKSLKHGKVLKQKTSYTSNHNVCIPARPVAFVSTWLIIEFTSLCFWHHDSEKFCISHTCTTNSTLEFIIKCQLNVDALQFHCQLTLLCYLNMHALKKWSALCYSLEVNRLTCFAPIIHITNILKRKYTQRKIFWLEKNETRMKIKAKNQLIDFSWLRPKWWLHHRCRPSWCSEKVRPIEQWFHTSTCHRGDETCLQICGWSVNTHTLY